MRERIIIFSRYPEPGRAKTRLIPALGPEGAADLQRNMTEHTVAKVRELVSDRPSVSVEIRCTGDSPDRFRTWLGENFEYRSQSGKDLGERMDQAFRESFSEGTARVVIIGTDCPELTAGLISSAFLRLEEKDMVLGPAADGGYYLIGLSRPAPEIFLGISWGTGEVTEKTLKKAARLGLSAHVLPPLDDIDRPQDLPVWERKSGSGTEQEREASISVIIPTRNEEAVIGTTLASIDRTGILEILVVDGESTDTTVERARDQGVRVLSTGPGRAAQMNFGAGNAKGDVLLFLHADTRPPPEFSEDIRRVLSDPAAVGGAFELRIDSPAVILRLIESLANWRSRRLRMPYGDQGLFVRSDIFRELGGFPDIPVMEDFEFVRRLKSRGKLCTVPASVLTSPRRWSGLGILRTTMINQVMVLAYFAGISPERMARWYSGKKERPA